MIKKISLLILNVYLNEINVEDGKIEGNVYQGNSVSGSKCNYISTRHNSRAFLFNGGFCCIDYIKSSHRLVWECCFLWYVFTFSIDQNWCVAALQQRKWTLFTWYLFNTEDEAFHKLFLLAIECECIGFSVHYRSFILVAKRVQCPAMGFDFEMALCKNFIFWIFHWDGNHYFERKNKRKKTERKDLYFWKRRKTERMDLYFWKRKEGYLVADEHKKADQEIKKQP